MCFLFGWITLFTVYSHKGIQDNFFRLLPNMNILSSSLKDTNFIILIFIIFINLSSICLLFKIRLLINILQVHTCLHMTQQHLILSHFHLLKLTLSTFLMISFSSLITTEQKPVPRGNLIFFINSKFFCCYCFLWNYVPCNCRSLKSTQNALNIRLHYRELSQNYISMR